MCLSDAFSQIIVRLWAESNGLIINLDKPKGWYYIVLILAINQSINQNIFSK